MNEQVKTIDDYLAALKRRKWQFIVPAALLSVLAALIALLIPPTYRSSATILIEQQEIPLDLVRTTVSSFADQRIQVISQRVMTTRNLAAIIERYNLYADLRRKVSTNDVIETMRKAIDRKTISADVVDPRSGRPQQAMIAFSISYDNERPELAQKVTNDLVSLYLNENLEQRQAAVEQATVFLGAEATKLRERIAALDSQLAAFKEQHGSSLPEFATLNREMMARTEGRLHDNEQAARTLEEQRVYLESELAKLDATSPASPLSTSSGTSPQAQLQELEARYVGIAARYAPNHPDRIQIERELAGLREQLGQPNIAVLQSRLSDLTDQLLLLRKRYSETHPDVVALKRSVATTQADLAKAERANRSDNPQRAGANASNPAYMQLQTKLAGTRAELESLKQARAEFAREIAKYEAVMAAAPKTEQEYKALVRDYESATLRYREVTEKEMQAQLARSLESDRKGERFSLIEPPLLPDEPFKPNRPVILIVGLVFSMAGGFGNLATRELLDKSVRGARAVLAITGVQPLATIPYIDTKADRRLRARHVRRWTLGILIALVAGVAAIHFFWMPLDVIWFKLLGRIGVFAPISNPSAR